MLLPEVSVWGVPPTVSAVVAPVMLPEKLPPPLTVKVPDVPVLLVTTPELEPPSALIVSLKPFKSNVPPLSASEVLSLIRWVPPSLNVPASSSIVPLPVLSPVASIVIAVELLLRNWLLLPVVELSKFVPDTTSGLPLATPPRSRSSTKSSPRHGDVGRGGAGSNRASARIIDQRHVAAGHVDVARDAEENIAGGRATQVF